MMFDESISQAEIDALVRGIMGGDEPSPASKGADDISALQEPLRAYCAGAGHALGDLVGVPCSGALSEVTATTVAGLGAQVTGEFLGGKADFIAGMSGGVWYLVPSFLGLSMITQLYGGVAPSYMDDSALGALAEGLTQMTQAGLQKLGETLGRAVSASQVEAVTMSSVTDLPGLVPTAKVVAAGFDLTVADTAGKMYVIFPQETIAPVAEAVNLKAQAKARPAEHVTPPAAAAAAAAFAAPPAPAPAPRPAAPVADTVPYQTAQFPDLASRAPRAEEVRNMDLLMDVQLQVTVELGRTRRQIRDVLAMGPGSVVELDKLAGEQVDVLVNGKLIAKGEVVVIDENYGVRITDIISPADRVQSLK